MISIRRKIESLSKMLDSECTRLFGPLRATSSVPHPSRSSSSPPNAPTVINDDDDTEDEEPEAQNQQARHEPSTTTKEVEPVTAEDTSWMQHLRIGVHAIPSMNHVHVHILSPEMQSDALKTKSHYNSFTTPFFIPLSQFPVTQAQLQEIVQQEYKKQDMQCWNCGRECKNVPLLKTHLQECWQTWRRKHQ